MADSSDRTTIDFRRLRAAPLPEAPSDDADYVPVLTVSGSDKTLTWEEGASLGSLTDVEDDLTALTARVEAGADVTPLTDNTGVTPDRTLANVVAADAAAGEATAADLTTTNAALAVLEANVSDLADTVNDLIAALAAV